MATGVIFSLYLFLHLLLLFIVNVMENEYKKSFLLDLRMCYKTTEKKRKRIFYQKLEYVNFSVNNADGNSGPRNKRTEKYFQENIYCFFNFSF